MLAPSGGAASSVGGPSPGSPDPLLPLLLPLLPSLPAPLPKVPLSAAAAAVRRCRHLRRCSSASAQAAAVCWQARRSAAKSQIRGLLDRVRGKLRPVTAEVADCFSDVTTSMLTNVVHLREVSCQSCPWCTQCRGHAPQSN